MRSTFASLIFAAAASVTATLAVSSPVRAEVEYPWCGVIANLGGGDPSCTFTTIDQCRAYVSVGGYCQPNPRASVPAVIPRRATTR
jgi:hypothetical protein